MTVFWDILHYWKLLQLEDCYPSLKQDRLNIENQIIELVKSGHDIQLHLHPHWLDTEYIQGEWVFIFDRNRLHSLSKRKDPKDINTILGCVTITKNLVESICRRADPNYDVFAFRAGGYCIQPFEILSDALWSNGIYIDSSAYHGFEKKNEQFSYDFSNTPIKPTYRFSSDINKQDLRGKFVEFQIGSIKIHASLKFWWASIRRLKYRNLEACGKGVGKIINKSGIYEYILKFFNSFVYPNYVMLTPDHSFREQYDYLIKKAKNGSVLILHPKYLNNHKLELTEKHLKNNLVKFVSIQEMIKNYGNEKLI